MLASTVFLLLSVICQRYCPRNEEVDKFAKANRYRRRRQQILHPATSESTALDVISADKLTPKTRRNGWMVDAASTVALCANHNA